MSKQQRRVQASKQLRWAKRYGGAFESARLAAHLNAESGQSRQFVHPATV